MMNLKNLFTEDDAVSPVIGVILMVAITVILAAVIGAFVLNIGGNQEAAPQLSVDFSYSGSSATLEHAGGGTLQNEGLSVSTSGGGSCSLSTGNAPWNAGDEIATCSSLSSGDSVSLTWTSSSGDSSQIIAESTAP